MMNKAVLVAMEHMTQEERDQFQINVFASINVAVKDYIKTKKENPGFVVYKHHELKINVGRRRRQKSPYFSEHAIG